MKATRLKPNRFAVSESDAICRSVWGTDHQACVANIDFSMQAVVPPKPVIIGSA